MALIDGHSGVVTDEYRVNWERIFKREERIEGPTDESVSERCPMTLGAAPCALLKGHVGAHQARHKSGAPMVEWGRDHDEYEP